MLGQVSSHPDLLRQVSITVKVFCVLLKLKAIVLLQLHHVSLKRLLRLAFLRSSMFLKASWKWNLTGFFHDSLTYLQVIRRPLCPLRLSFVFLMYFSLTLAFQSNQTGQPLEHFSLSSVSINLISSICFLYSKKQLKSNKKLQKVEIPEPFMHF